MTRQLTHPSPSAWLWAEIARRYGDDAALELREAYNEQNRLYQREKWHNPESPEASKVRPGRKRLKR